MNNYTFFSEESFETVEKMLSNYKGPEQERTIKAILDLSKGNMTELEHYVKCANRDYRDVLYWSEYPQEADGKSI